MRYAIVFCALFVLGCDEEDLGPIARYADGTTWSAIVPAEPGRIAPADMTLREWDRFIQDGGFLADSQVKTFTPAWSGFSADPSGDIYYFDFGALVVMFVRAELTGTSSLVTMGISNVPEVLRPPSGEERAVKCLVIDSNSRFEGTASIIDAAITFGNSTVSGTHVLANSGGFTAAGVKGLPGGWLIMYPK